MIPQSHRRRLTIFLAAVGTCFGMATPSAEAGLLVASASGCDESASSQVFMPWVDPANYFLTPGGDFESGAAGWSVSGNADVVDGNEPWRVVGSDDASSLRLGAGSSATSPVVCVGIEHPTVRFFAAGGGLFSSLRVEVLFEDAFGNMRDLTIGRVLPGSWSPTPAYVVVANLLPLLPGSHTPVAFRFTPEGLGSWRIDDVHVDPYGRQ